MTKMRKVLTIAVMLIMCMTSAMAEATMDASALTEEALETSLLTEESAEAAAPSVMTDMTAAQTESVNANLEKIVDDARKAAKIDKYGGYLPMKEFEWTTVPLVTFGVIAKINKKNFREARNNFIPSYENHLDDYLQHVPLAATTIMNIAGYEGRSNTWRYLVSAGASYATMAILVNGIKYSAREMRPDGSRANSFPSGHTATAFVAATIMHKEYGLTRSPWWSVLAYTCATTTGIMRTLNNRHWISDVLVGAGIGVISTDIGYMIGDYIFKNKGIKRRPLQTSNDMFEHPSFFRLSLGMQMTNNITIPTNLNYTTMQRLWSEPGAATLADDYYEVLRNGNPFRIPDNFNAAPEDRTYGNYLSSKAGNEDGSRFGLNPKITIGVGTTVGAEGAYFFNKYIGAGMRARISTAAARADGLSCYDNKQRYIPSAVTYDIWSMVDINAGVYAAWPISPRHNVGAKLLYGRRFFGALDLQAKYDAYYKQNGTENITHTEIQGDDLYINSTNSDDVALGLSYTYSLNSGMAISGFVDYDFSKPTFKAEYVPYNPNIDKMLSTSSSFEFKQKMHSWTIGASMNILF